MNKDYYVYLLKRPDGRVFYVGMGRGNRSQAHEWKAIQGAVGHRYNVIRKVLASGKRIKVEKITDGLSPDIAKDLEIKTIARYGRKKDGGVLVNVTLGGDGAPGYTHDLIARAKISESRKDYRWSDEQRARFKKAMTGRPIADSTKKKISEALKGERHWNFGRKMPAETSEKLHGSRRRKILAEGRVYESIKDASESIGRAVSTIIYRIQTGKEGYQYIG